MFRRLKVVYLKARSEGAIPAIKWLMKTTYYRIIPQRQVIWCVDLTRINTEEFPMPNDIEMQRFYSLDQVDKEDYKTLIEYGTALMGSAGSILICERFAKGAVLWLLKVDGKLAGYRWTIVNDHVNPTYVPQTSSDVHSIGIEIFQGFRGRNLFKIIKNGGELILKEEGFSRCYSETYLVNKNAIKAHLKIGVRSIGIATIFNVFGKNVVVWHDMSGKTEFK